MTADECHVRAARCAENAALSPSEAVSTEFLRLAAQWRAMAVREILLGLPDSLTTPPVLPEPSGPVRRLAN
jgi:hypothetical protein